MAKRKYTEAERERDRIRAKKWLEENPERAKATKRKYIEKNKEKIIEKGKIYRKKNKKKLQLIAKKRRHTKKWKEYNKNYCKKYFQKNKERDKEKRRLNAIEYRKKNKKRLAKKRKEYKKKNKQKLQKQNHEYLMKNAESRSIKAKEWAKNNPEKARERRRKAHIRTMKNPNRRIRCSLRATIRSAIMRFGSSVKKESTLELIGCSIAFLRTHLESNFHKDERISWKTYGIKGWHIDHIIPCALFDLTKLEERKKCFNWTNLQPLWGIDNCKKGKKLNYFCSPSPASCQSTISSAGAGCSS